MANVERVEVDPLVEVAGRPLVAAHLPQPGDARPHRQPGFPPGHANLAAGKTMKKDNVKKGSTEGASPAEYQSVVKVRRNGEMTIPVEVLMVFEKATRSVRSGTGRTAGPGTSLSGRQAGLRGSGSGTQIVLDSDFTNNSKTVVTRGLPALSLSARFLNWFEMVLHAVAFLA